ncbi:MAG: hypothetical protein N2327_08110 [Caldimicrobium sp.]|nr:hypothetical protein [Caldimicrobium sp.]MCX7874371.1 hypothetical protein [Caldimicrobium sp.]MDW8093497.1 hypothetical protein [Caldimicrobium sp.]
MIIKVARGNYEIIQRKAIHLKTEYLGAGIAIGFINRSQQAYGLLTYFFPYREFDIEIDGAQILSGESILERFQEELERRKIALSTCRWFLAGASVFKENPKFLDLAEKNLKVAEAWFKRMDLGVEIIKKVSLSEPTALQINGKEMSFILKIQNRIEHYE